MLLNLTGKYFAFQMRIYFFAIKITRRVCKSYVLLPKKYNETK